MAPTEQADSLMVVDRLTVGPPSIEFAKITVPYVLTKKNETVATELIYKWEENVFDPDEEASRNLASIIGAQVAVNYGLVCREILFRGVFDGADKRFLEEAVQNTSREIYVNKILMPNPFLAVQDSELYTDEFQRVAVAGLRFEDLKKRGKDTPWSVNRDRLAVLSSGGKDSLLSYGLLNEMGLETHPVFCNESGRHWYTALNAYRHFRDKVPHTARVWLNSDRLFSWMLRNLPFIRKDFGGVRSDEYPVRLWTVAVFLFGALPLLRKRGIGRLLVGNEYDTTLRARFRGISHYAGLYDQSRFFDNHLTRYFAKKGYGVSQFSLLRQMSELLIEKTLVERYPDLQRHQMSCHATHIEGEYVRPCGNCEKCRRIIGMLMAAGADPTRSGFTSTQIEAGLKTLGAHRLHQERAGNEHLNYMLAEQGHLAEDAPLLKSGRPHPEVLALRFDNEKSPVDTIPADLRQPLYQLLLQHAHQGVRKSGRLWLEFDPLCEESLTAPYQFERPLFAPKPGEVPTAKQRGFVLGELTWPEAKARLKETDIALLPVGAIEQHGRHLPLDLDAFDADKLSRDVARACGAPVPLVLPLIPYGVSYHHEGFAGTIAISPSTLSQIAYEIGMNVAKQGITKLIIVNGHGGNGPALHFAAQMINRDARIFTCVETGETSDDEVEKLISTPNDVHAGEIETSTALAQRPELVKMDQARRNVPRFSSDYLNFSSSKRVDWYVHTSRISKSGVLGDPTKGTAEKGRKMWAIMVHNLVELVEHLKNLTLDEIYQRRY